LCHLGAFYSALTCPYYKILQKRAHIFEYLAYFENNNLIFFLRGTIFSEGFAQITKPPGSTPALLTLYGEDVNHLD